MSDELKNLEANMQQWRDLLADDKMPSQFKSLIQTFFLPYKINPVKYLVNHDGTTDPYRYIMYEGDPLFSETLRKFQQEPTLKAMGYPHWFYLAFPDVAMWAIQGKGKQIVLNKLSAFSEEEVMDSENNKIRSNFLEKIILLYILDGNELEIALQDD